MKLECSFDHQGLDGVMTVHCHYPKEINTYLHNNVMDISAVISRSFHGNKRIQSDGLRGVIADSSPIDATVVIMQEHNGVLVEIARTTSPDGSWSFENLPNAKSHAIAFRETFNAGITSGLQPED